MGDVLLKLAIERLRQDLQNHIDGTATVRKQQAEIERDEALAERDRWKRIVSDECEAAEGAGLKCLDSCDSYGHDDACPYVYPIQHLLRERDEAMALLREALGDVDYAENQYSLDVVPPLSDRIRALLDKEADDDD